MMLSLSSDGGGGGFAIVLITRRIMGCMLDGAAAAAASSTCSDFALSSLPSCATGDFSHKVSAESCSVRSEVGTNRARVCHYRGMVGLKSVLGL